jgi:hypothetical protein
MNVIFNEKNDFVVTDHVAEVKSIHDDYNRVQFEQNNGLLTKSIHYSYKVDDLLDEISTKLLQNKWCNHLAKAIGKQEAKIVFINATQSPDLGRVSVFIEQHMLNRDFKEIINNAMEFIDKNDVIPVVVTMEAMHNLHVLSSLFFLLPITRLNGGAEIDMKRYNKNFLKENIFL